MRSFVFFLGLISVAAALPGLPTHDATDVPLRNRSSRRPDRQWSHVIRGSHVKALGNYDGHLDNYSLRASTVQLSRLHVDNVRQFSGYLDDDFTDKHLFYWFFESRNDPKKDPVILWMNGGPGCSSTGNIFSNLGPSRFTDDGKLIRNEYSWNSNASIIFLDQPVNTGFSYSRSVVDTSAAAARDVYAMMTLFFEQFPQYAKQDFHIAGASYAGHYIPSLAAEILSHTTRNINLKSVMIGNGFTDPYVQVASYEPMACGKGGYKALLNETECQDMHYSLPRCQRAIKACYGGNRSSCIDSLVKCEATLVEVLTTKGFDVYDVRSKRSEWRNKWGKSHDYVGNWLNQENVMQALGVEVDKWIGCSYPVQTSFFKSGDSYLPSQRYIPDILRHIPVLIYAGDADYICNWLGNLAWMKALSWPGRAAFNAAQTTEVRGPSGKVYGSIMKAKGFAFLKVFKAGHDVSQDQPEGALDLVNRWRVHANVFVFPRDSMAIESVVWNSQALEQLARIRNADDLIYYKIENDVYDNGWGEWLMTEA
ncbi:carboxypeptidase Y precursor [Metarhizium rileyi]|uniref:carboxypeptidase C n=1 Tax=Metarhizium rileyi (strain RCEF 4871) TaxID=1649241 RepID=A0A167G3G0_METRR|nr:carboxypeptidase Y precursor [Metarhizium rileyi RCEF 4871]